MKVIGIIPARYDSSRLPGKPLADICGRPMIWWVYQQVKKVPSLQEVYVAIDDEKIEAVCKNFGIPYMMTSSSLPEHISRIHEVSEHIQADYYLCVNGDEPLISPSCISCVIPEQTQEQPFFGGAVRKLTDPAEVIDFSNLKVVLSDLGKCVYISRAPVPYPRGTLLFDYYKYMGIECFNKEALDFFVRTPQGRVERIEDIDHLRFLENGVELHFTKVRSESISVDTPKDLEKVRSMVKAQIDSGELRL